MNTNGFLCIEWLDEFYKSAFTESINTSNCPLNENEIDHVNRNIISSIKSCVGKEANDWLPSTAVLDGAHEANADQSFELNSRRTRGRYSNLSISVNSVHIVNEDSVCKSIVDDLAKFVGTNNLGPSKRHGYRPELARLILNNESYFNLKQLLYQGLLYTALYVSSSGISKSLPDEMLGSTAVAGAISEFRISPIFITLYLHDPIRTVNRSTSTEYEFVDFSWKNRKTGRSYQLRLIFAVPNNFEVTLRAEMEYAIERRYATSWYADVLTIGLTYMAFDDTAKSNFTSRQFELELTCTSNCLKRKSKIEITISVEAANRFLEIHSRLNQIKQINKHNNIDPILLSAPVGLIQPKVKLLEHHNIIVESIAKAFLKCLEIRESTFANAKSFSDLNNINKGGTVGLVFEEVVNGYFMAAASKQNLKYTSVAGDGKGFIAENQPSPIYSDLIYKCDDGQKFYSFQLKCSQNEHDLRHLINEYTAKHSQPGGSLPEGLHFENTEIVVPKGFKLDSIEVPIYDKGKFVKNATIKVTSKIKVGTMEIEVPSFVELEKLVEENFEILQQIAKEGWISVERKNPRMIHNLIAKIRKKKECLIKIGENHKEAKNRMEDKLDAYKRELENLEEELYIAKNEIPGAVDKLKEKKAKQICRAKKLTLLRNCIIVGAVTDAGITLIQSLDRNIRLYKDGNITIGKLCMDVSKDTVVATFRGAVVSGCFAAVSNLGGFLPKCLGPGICTVALVYQAYTAFNLESQGLITPLGRNKMIARSLFTMGASTAATIGVAMLLGTGLPALLVGAGACIAVASGDYYLGDKIMTFLFGDDDVDSFEKEVIDNAYKLFDLEANCSDKELKDAYYAASRKYHKDKQNQRGDSEFDEEQSTSIMQAVTVAYNFLKEIRSKALLPLY